MMTLTLTLVGLLVGAQPAGDFFVAPGGSDENPGTEQVPFASIARAQRALRELTQRGIDRDLLVVLRGGTYALDAPLVFAPEDAGTAEHSVTYAAYPGETPVLSGGILVDGWQRAADGKWTTSVPAVKAGARAFRQLFRDGVRLPRGRFPNADALLKVASVSDDVRGIVFDEPLPAGDWAGHGAELVMYQNWSITRQLVAAAEGNAVRVAAPMGWIGHGDATTASPGKPAYIENAAAFVDQPGEWYLDAETGVIIYQAAEGEKPEQFCFIAPILEQLLVVRGREDAPVRNLRFSGLTFAYAEWPLPDVGYAGIQAGHYGTTMKEPFRVLPLALEFVRAEGCELLGCTVTHIGACAVGFGAGCRFNRVAECTIADIGGNGIMVGWRGTSEGSRLAGDESLSADWNSPGDAPIANEIRNNTVRTCGAVNHGCVGIFDAFSNGTSIAHNLVTDMPYTGVSIGYRWDETATNQRGCRVEYNHIHDVMKMLADGGGIYTLGYQPGTVLRGNLIHNVHRSAFAQGGAPNNGVFFDQGSKGFLIEENVIYDTSGDPLRFNQTNPRNFLWKENALGPAPGQPGFPEENAKRAGPIEE